VWRNGAKIASVGSDIVARVGAANGVDEICPWKAVVTGVICSPNLVMLQWYLRLHIVMHYNAYAPKLVPESVGHTLTRRGLAQRGNGELGSPLAQASR
jgi:hypothetical protein